MARKNRNITAQVQPTSELVGPPAPEIIDLSAESNGVTSVVTALTPTPAQAPALVPVAPPKWANEAWASSLPKSLVAKHDGLLGAPKGIPATLADKRYVANGLAFQKARAHNLVWSTRCAEVCNQAGPQGATVQQMLEAGVGLHSVQAYIKRQWFVEVK